MKKEKFLSLVFCLGGKNFGFDLPAFWGFLCGHLPEDCLGCFLWMEAKRCSGLVGEKISGFGSEVES